MDRLPPEQLGNIGENMFRTLCGQARLVCNRSDRDVTGWDFIVEFAMTAPDARPLDQRPADACHVQLKSTAGESGSRVSAKLSAIERLAKDPRPALLVVFRLRSDGQPLAGYVVHLIGDELARVLKRLRTAEVQRAFNINRATISFDYQKAGTRFELTPDGLKAALLGEIGDDSADYIHEKQRQLAELGFERGGIGGEALIWIEGPDHFTDMMLGHIPVRPKRLQLYERRFDIRLPYRGALFDAVEEFRFELPKIGTCDVVVRGGAFAPAAVFEAEMLVPPPMPDGPWLLIRHPDFTITFREKEMNFQTVGTFGDREKGLADWAVLVRALRYLADEQTGRLSIDWKTANAAPFTVPLNQKLDGPYMNQLSAISRFLDGWQQLVEMAGLKSETPFAFDVIWDSSPAGLAVDMLLNPTPTAYLEFDDLDEMDAERGPVEAFYFNSCSFAGTAISYCVQITLHRTGKNKSYRSSAFRPLDVRPAVADLHEYGVEQAHRFELTFIIDPESIAITEPPRRANKVLDGLAGTNEKLGGYLLRPETTSRTDDRNYEGLSDE